MKIRTILGASLLLLASVQASAALVNNGNWTTDTQTGLDWLDLDLTWGMTLTDASNTYSGWRLASTLEYDGLFDTIFPNFTTSKFSTYDSHSNNDFVKHASQAENFFSLFGASPALNLPNEKSIQAFFLAENTGLDLMQLYWNSDIERVVIDPHDLRGYTPDDTGGQVSLYFVRTSTVPIPAAIWLIGTAMIALVGFSRRG